ncbi:MAG: SoxR reducing system RseC family protein [Clostridia bacterium]
MTHIGNVIKASDKQVIIEVKKDEMCNTCADCKGCLKRTYEVITANNKNAKVGDRVKAYTPDNMPVLYIFLVAMIPIILLIVIYSVFYKINLLLGIVLSVVSLIIWLSFAIYFGNKLKKNSKYSSYILEILK